MQIKAYFLRLKECGEFWSSFSSKTTSLLSLFINRIEKLDRNTEKKLKK